MRHGSTSVFMPSTDAFARGAATRPRRKTLPHAPSKARIVEILPQLEREPEATLPEGKQQCPKTPSS